MTLPNSFSIALFDCFFQKVRSSSKLFVCSSSNSIVSRETEIFQMSVLFHENPGTSLGGDLQSTNDTNEQSETPEWLSDLFPNNTIIDGETHLAIRGFCRKALLTPIPGIDGLNVRVWDVAILIPNLLFFLFLAFKFKAVLRKIKTSNSPVYKAFFVLVYITTILNILRCTVSIGITMTNPIGKWIDFGLWVFLKFVSMTAELCVLTFALLFGHLDSATSIRRALLATLLISASHTTVQSLLELRVFHKSLTEDLFFDLDSQGGLVLWFLTSAVFAFIYVTVSCLPFTCCRRYVTLPSKCSFYWYCCFLSFLNVIQALGVVFIFFRLNEGYCITIFTTFNYFTFLPPLIYFTFLRTLLKPQASSNGGLFSYRKQKDERGAEDMAEGFYPRFSGLTSPSYDDLFDYERRDRFVAHDYTRDYLQCPYDTPLMAADTAESTCTTRTAGSEDGRQRDSMMSIEMGQPRQLKGLGANGTLVFEEPRWK